MAERDEQRRKALFAELARTGSVEVRNELVESFAPLAEYFANRYRKRGADHEDLRQVAKLALVRAVDRFDPEVGAAFSTFAGRTIDGELKRYFRDKSWAMRVPRSLQEAALEVRNAADQLSLEQGRPATVDELAERTGLDTETVLQALDVRVAMQTKSLDRPSGGSDGLDLGSTIGSIDPSIERTDVKLVMRRLIEGLPERERKIVEMRFYEELTQQQIAERMGISQMHVSRLLRATLTDLRGQLR